MHPRIFKSCSLVGGRERDYSLVVAPARRLRLGLIESLA